MDFIQPIYTSTRGGKIFDSNLNSVNETFIGNGFFAEGNYFITALHVIQEAQAESSEFVPYIKYKGKKIELKLEEAVSCLLMPNKEKCDETDYQNNDNGDLVAFKIEGAKCEMKLSNSLPTSGQTLKNSYFIKNSLNGIELKETIGIVCDLGLNMGNFFTATMTPSHPTQGGSSGSPIYCGDTVYGVLHAGYEEMPDICVFCSPKQATRALKSAPFFISNTK